MPVTRAHLRSALLLVLFAAAGCAAHDKAGDKAAALGDWKAAYVEYRQALEGDAKDPELKKKYDDARARALAQSVAQARACARQADWGCALGEADFALSIDGASAEMGDLKRQAARAVALDKVREAEAQLDRGAVQPAGQLLADARRLSREPDVDAAAGRAERRWVGAALAEAERLRVARRYPDAIQLAQAAANLDPAARPQADRLVREYEAFRDAEHDRLLQEGERALSQNAWLEAADRLRAAQAARPDPRAQALERYARAVAAGDKAVEAGDFRAATARYQEALDLRVERSGYAADQLARVAVRPWAVRVRSALVDPLRPGGVPWVGPPSRDLDRVSRELARGFEAVPFGLLERLPRPNRPTFRVEVVLPDGRRAVTATRQGAYVSFDTSAVVLANAYDRRRLVLEVVHEEAGGLREKVATVELTVGELVSRGAVQLRSAPLLALELTAEPADGAPEGALTGLTVLGAPPAKPVPAPPAKPGPTPAPPAPTPAPKPPTKPGH